MSRRPLTLHARSALLLSGVLTLGSAPLSGQEARQPLASGLDLPVVERVLDNGLRLLILPRGESPTVSLVVHYAVGGVNEVPGNTGIAHLLEHLLFKGSSRLGTIDVEQERRLFSRMDGLHEQVVDLLDHSDGAPTDADSVRVAELRAGIRRLEDTARPLVVANEFDRRLSSMGARGLNATTTNESTMYFVELPANRLESWFALEAERMLDPVFREFHTERDVVTEERRLRVETNPGGRLYEAHLESAWDAHPYRQPVVGSMRDLERLSRGEVAEYYDRFYGAANAVVAIVGDVEVDRVMELAESWFGPARSGEPPPAVDVGTELPKPTRTHVAYDAEPLLKIGWHVPAADHADTPALTMLSALLTGGRTSLLHRELVEEQAVVTSAITSIGPGERFPRLFNLDVVPRAPASPAQIEVAALELIERVKLEGFGVGAIDRVRNQLLASELRRLRSNFGIALQLATSAGLYGDWRETFRFPGRMRAVTENDVLDVARRYLVPDRMVVTTLGRPESIDAGDAR